MNLFGKINMANSDPGPMIERNYAAENGNDRYGLGQYPNGTTRVYAAGGFGPATVNLSIARDNGAFDDVLSVRTNNTVSVNGDLSVQKKITFKEMGDNTDPYYLEKINNGDNNSHLRLTINDDADESFQIWGDSCSTGNCGGPGVMRHMFKANGDAEHGGNMKVAKNIAGKNVYASALCIGDEVNNVCLRKEELSLLKQQLALAPAPASSTTTTLTSKIIEGIPGLIGFYVAENFTGGKWVDASTAKNDVVAIKGAPTKVKSPLNNRDMISFTFNDGMTFPATILPQTYTLFHLARLKQGGKRERVFDGKNTNWLSGFYKGNTGVAYHNAVITQGGDLYGNNWMISIDQNDMYIVNNTNRTIAKGGIPSHANLTINDGLTSANETSDCDVACVIVFNRTLPQNEYSIVSDEIRRMYGL
jgi:hypothetical protein